MVFWGFFWYEIMKFRVGKPPDSVIYRFCFERTWEGARGAQSLAVLFVVCLIYMKSIHIICVFQETKWLCCKGSREQFERNVCVPHAVWTVQVLRAFRGNCSQNPVSEWLFLFKSCYYIIYMCIIMLNLNRKLTWKRPSGIDSIMSDSSLKLTCLLFIWVTKVPANLLGLHSSTSSEGKSRHY